MDLEFCLSALLVSTVAAILVVLQMVIDYLKGKGN